MNTSPGTEVAVEYAEKDLASVLLGINHSGLRGDNYSRINTPEIFTVLMQTMDRLTIIMQRVHHVLVVAFHLLM